MFRVFVYVLIFLLKIKFRNKAISTIILERYDVHVLTKFRKYEKFDLKARRAKADVEFLNQCLINQLTPKFLNFKLSMPCYSNDHDYREFQKKLLRKELNIKQEFLTQCRAERDQSYSDLKYRTSYLDFNHMLAYAHRANDVKEDKFKATHSKKLFNLGLKSQYKKIPTNNLIFNLSERCLTEEENETLALGLKFCFTPSKISYGKFFAAYEQLHRNLSEHKIFKVIPDAENLVRSTIKSIALKTYYSFKPAISDLNKKRISILKSLSSDPSIIISKPDKGSGIVIMDRTSYIEKVNTILQDSTKFEKVSADLYKTLIKDEDRTNRLLEIMKKSNIINDTQKYKLRAVGSQPGILYGQPKVHKAGTPVRPILSTVNTHNYNMSKYLVSLLQCINDSPFIIKDSFSFVREIVEVENDDYCMASFDVKNLFTSIPIDETINIILDRLFPDSRLHKGFDRALFAKVLQNCTKNNVFLFNEECYRQIDGAPMGGCISPLLADIFLGYHEQIWFNNCPSEFKPVYFKRYVDDTFLLFRSSTHINLFLNYLNSQHAAICFTCDREENNKISFLDVNIHKFDTHFETSLYRKKTFSGLMTRFDSSVSKIYKLNLISCLCHRAYQISSTFSHLTREFENIRKFLCQNGYPLNLVDKIIGKNLNKFHESVDPLQTADRKTLYVPLPYISEKINCDVRTEITKLVSKFYPQLDLRFIFKNSFSVGSFFRFKDSIPSMLQNDVVYLYTCAQCSATYCGETSRHLQTRICEHRGISSRTGQRLTKTNSNIFNHFLETDHPVVSNSFKIVQRCKSGTTKIHESIFIHKNSPSLNSKDSSMPLAIL